MSQTDTIYVKMASKMDFRAKMSIIQSPTRDGMADIRKRVLAVGVLD